MKISKVKCFSIQSAECYYFLTGLHQKTFYRNWLNFWMRKEQYHSSKVCFNLSCPEYTAALMLQLYGESLYSASLPPQWTQPFTLPRGTHHQQKSHSKWQTEISCLFWGRESDKNGLVHRLWGLCGNVQSLWDGHCASPWPPQCRNAAAPAGLQEPAGPALPAGTKRDEPPTPEWQGTAGSL